MNNRTERKPETFDWVTERAACSASKMFEKLRGQVEKDVQIRKAMCPQGLHYGFTFISTTDTMFSVLVEGHHIHEAVIFKLERDTISAASNRAPLFQATVTLSEDGECRAKVAGQECDSWQLRKIALEDLFFREY
jgi:hypothetical protein